MERLGQTLMWQLFSGMDPSCVLPDNVAIISLQELDDGTVLLRLAHLYEVSTVPFF